VYGVVAIPHLCRTVDGPSSFPDESSREPRERTPDEQKYDHEVIRWMHRGKSVTKAIAKANEKYPAEALKVDNDNLADVQAHYEYLAEHEAIMEKLDALKK
jgi:hypothetical protein